MKKVKVVAIQKRGISSEGKTPICEMARQAIMKGLDASQTIALVLKAHPKSIFSKKCYYWFRNHLRKGDYDKMYGKKVKVPTLGGVKK